MLAIKFGFLSLKFKDKITLVDEGVLQSTCGGQMKAVNSRSLVLVMLLALAACTNLPQKDKAPQPPSASVKAQKAKPFTQKPGDITFGNVSADVMYDVLIGELAVQRGNPQVASDFYLDAAKKSKNPQIASRSVSIANFADKKTDALESAKIWVKAEPKNTEAVRVLAILYLRENNTEEAQKLLAELLNKDKESLPRNLLLTGAMLQRETSLKTAEKVSRYLTKLYPNQAESFYVHASLALQAGMNQDALTSIKKALAIKPKWIDAIILYPRILEENAQGEKALKFLSDYLSKHPKQDAVRLTYARILTTNQKLKEARDQFELLAIKMPNNQDVLFALAMLSMQFKEYNEAQSYLMRLEKLGKANSQVYFYLGQIAEQKKDLAKALQWYKKVQSKNYYLESQLRISVIIAKTESLKKALEFLHAIKVQKEDDKRQVSIFEGNLLRDFKQYQAAFDFYTKLLKKNPKDLDFLYFRALVAERLNRLDVIIKDLSYVIETDPENAAALNALGYTLADKTNKLDEALKLIMRARELEPNDPAITDSLGWVNYKLGKTKVALKYLKEAMEQISDGEVAAHYGEVLWKSGNKEKAKEVWKKAKEKFSDNDVLLETIKRFEK